MITKKLYKEVIEDIKDLKKGMSYYLKDDPDIIEERSLNNFKLILLIIFTPLFLVVDLFLLPLELLYLILDILLWRVNW